MKLFGQIFLFSLIFCYTYPPPQSKEVNLDYEIVNSVLKYLVQDKNFNETLSKPSLSSQIVLASSFPDRLISADLVTDENGKITIQQAKLDQLLKNLVARNAEADRSFLMSKGSTPAVDWSNFASKEKSILVKDVSSLNSGIDGWTQFKGLYPQAKGYVCLWLPGYDKAKKSALVHFLIGPSAHGGVGTCILERKKTTWKIVWVNYRFFL